VKSLVILSVSALIAVAMAEAQDSEPKSSPTPSPASSEMEEPALPNARSYSGRHWTNSAAPVKRTPGKSSSRAANQSINKSCVDEAFSE
jgi:hypothetical protein